MTDSPVTALLDVLVPSPIQPPAAPQDATMRVTMKQEIDRLNDNRMFLIATLEDYRVAYANEHEQNDILQALVVALKQGLSEALVEVERLQSNIFFGDEQPEDDDDEDDDESTM